MSLATAISWTTAVTSNTAPEHEITHGNKHGHTGGSENKGFEKNQKQSSKYPLGRKHSFAFSSVFPICPGHLQ